MKKKIKIIFKFTFLSLIIGGIFSKVFSQEIIVGANRTEQYFPLLKEKKIGVVAHPASVIFNSNGYTHLIDSLNHFFDIVKIFAPEHGFRGDKSNGEIVKDSIDPETGIPILSLYGKNKAPSKKSLENIEVMVFDLQDVGVRFYTYLSTLHHIMESCAAASIPLILLDRPNPNAHYIDGPVLDTLYKSFVGLHPVPIVYGMTIGEYAHMINEEGWLKENKKCSLSVIKMENYTHKMPYDLIIKPSPNLPNAQAIALYPSLCFFEQTPISVGRGTEMQFQIYGHPVFPVSDFKFKPRPNFGSKYPKLEGQICYGEDLRTITPPREITIKWLLKAYEQYPKKEEFFKKGFHLLAGNKDLERQIKSGWEAKKIKKKWQKDLEKFKRIRKKYLFY